MVTLTLQQRITARMDRLSKGHLRIAAYLSEHGSASALLTASELAVAVGISEATVVRFAQALGYGGYPDLRRDLEHSLRSDITALNRLNSTVADEVDEWSVAQSLHKDLSSIQRTAATLDEEQVKSAAKAILAARHIWTVGALMSVPAAHLLRTGLRMVGLDARLLDTTAGSPELEIQGECSDDVFVSVALQRYSSSTIDAVDLAQSTGMTCIAITDDPRSPTAALSSVVILVAPTELEFFQSTASVTAVVGALITECAVIQPDRARAHLAEVERHWATANTFASR